ncbi:MAG TPA: HAMP domain-containing sensor histidine kinase [Puia sp.]|nr:HAMP domain-containing sensor histidine kinase [Puia sp.]
MKRGMRFFISLLLLFISAMNRSYAQEPDLSKMHDDKEKIRAMLDYCESLRLNTGVNPNNSFLLQRAALKGISITPADDATDLARFNFYCAFGCYYQVKFDSAQYYFYQSLHAAQKAKSAEFISSACVALIPVNFQLRQQDRVDSCKDILQSILDTTHNKKILQDGYSAMGSYYQQKAYYSTSEDYLIKSLELRKTKVDTTTDVKLKSDYAIQCYILSKEYGNTDVLNKSLAILKEGLPFSGYSPVVHIRYLSSFTEIYSMLGNIDSALYYERTLEETTKNSPVVLSELVSANLNIAKYYIEHQMAGKALPYITRADTLAVRSKSPILIFQAALWKGRYQEQNGNYAGAIASLNQSLPLAKQLNKEQYAEGLKYMAEAEKGAGNANEAYRYFALYSDQSDSLIKEKISQNLADQETRYETNKKELHIASLSKENKLELLELQEASRTRLFLILALVALGIIALLLYFIYRNKESSNQVLNERNYQLDLLNQKLEVANNTKTKLFSIIGHDLRSPISQVVQLLHIRKKDATQMTEDARQKHENKIQEASENVLDTMEDLLLWSKSQMQQFTPEFRMVDITAVLAKEIALLDPLAKNKLITVHSHVEPRFLQKTDENFITVIIRNLLQNAIRYSDPNSTVEISNEAGKLVISNQSSIPADKLNDQLNNREVNSRSVGLGLQIVQDLAAAIRVNIQFHRQNTDRILSTIDWNV